MNTAELKRRAKARIADLGWKPVILLFLIPIVMQIFSTWSSRPDSSSVDISSTSSSASDAVSSIPGWLGVALAVFGIATILIAIAIGLVGSIFQGNAIFVLMDKRDAQSNNLVPSQDMFQSFRNGDWLPILTISLIQTLVVFICLVPAIIAFLIGIAVGPFVILGLVLTIAGLIAAIIVNYGWTQAIYIGHDLRRANQYVSAFDCLKRSWNMMRGYKGTRFYLDLTFFGWLLVAAITFGLATIYVMPYQQTTNLEFYDELQTKLG
jgi:uncharacterized membrane protein